MGEMDDEGTWVLVYNDETTAGSLTTEEAYKAAVAEARLSVVPDFWIDPVALTIKYPPYKTTDRINTAICKRYKPTDDWSEYPILKARTEAPKPTYKEALDWLKICQEESSGAEDAYNELNDKAKRKDRAKGSKYENGEYIDPTKSKLCLAKTESENSKEESVMALFEKLPAAPPQVLLSTTKMKGTHGVTEPADALKNTFDQDSLPELFQKSDDLNDEHENDFEIINDSTAPNELNKSKPKLIASEDVGQRYQLKNSSISIKQGNSQKTAKEKSAGKQTIVAKSKKRKLDNNNEENDHTAIPSTSTSIQPNFEQHSRANNVDALPPFSSLLSDLQHSIFVNALPASESPSDMQKFCEIMQAVGVKLDTIMKLMNQMILNQCKANVVGGQPAPAQTEENWLETRTLLKRFFAEMDNITLFEDFDQKLKESKKFRSKVVKYLIEKISHGDWKQTARDVLNAVMHLNVQKLYSGKGQPWGGKRNRSLVKTNVYGTLEAMVKIAVKKDEKISTRNIQSYFGNYIRTAKTRAGDYPSCKKRKKNGGTEGLAKALLFGSTDAEPCLSSEERNSDNEEKSRGPKRKRRKSNTKDKNLPGSDSEEEEQEGSDTNEEQKEREPELTESEKLEIEKNRRAQKSMVEEILNVSPDVEDEGSSEIGNGDEENYE